MKVKKVLALSVCRQLLTLLTSSLLILSFSKVLTVENFGQYSIFQVKSSVAVMLLSMGLPTLFIQKISSLGIESMYRVLNVYVTYLIFVVMILFLFLLLTSSFYLKLYLAFVSTGILLAAINSILMGIQKYLYSEFLNLIISLILLVLINFSSLISTFEEIIVTQTILNLIYFFVICVYLLNLKIKLRFSFDYILLINNIKLSFHSLVADCLGFCVYRIHYFLIQNLIGIRALGEFSLGQQISEKLWIPTKSLSYFLFPMMAKEEQKKNNWILIKNMAIICFFVCFLGMIGLNLSLIFIRDFFDFKALDKIDHLILPLSLGISSWSAVQILASFFASESLFKINMIISFVTLVSTSLGLLASIFYSYNLGYGLSCGYFIGLIMAVHYFIREKKI